MISVDIPDARQTLTEKSVFANSWMYEHHLDDFDWFLKADDDTYVIMENLKFLLSHFKDSTVPGYIGCQFKHFSPQGYNSGGAGYLFNRAGLKLLVEEGYRRPGHCRLAGGSEDIETGRCAAKVGVKTLDQLDSQKRETFFPNNVYENAVPGPVGGIVEGYMRSGSRIKPGLACCSPLLVSFHYMDETSMYTAEFLLYRVHVHGRSYTAERAGGFFGGKMAEDMNKTVKRMVYPGEKMQEYYEGLKQWKEENATIYIGQKKKH